MRFLVRLSLLFLCVVLLTGAGNVLKWHLNLTDSLPRGIYREVNEPITRGVYVAECLPPDLVTLGVKRGWLRKGSCPSGAAPILKQVVGVEGDVIMLGEKYVAVNGHVYLGTPTLKLDSQGRWMPAFPRGEYVLTEGEVFLLATKILNSWDGRYTGPTQLKDIIAVAKPVWTEAAREQ